VSVSRPPSSSGLRWLRSTQLPPGAPDARLRDWLFDPTSLTRRVREACTGKFRVRVERQDWGRPRLDEYRALALRMPRRALIREVHLLCDERPWIFARTIIPASTLRGPQRRLLRLGARPLGAVLFADPRMRRGPVEVAEIPLGHPLYAAAVHGLSSRPAAVWGRRSVFWMNDKPLLVAEIFLMPKTIRG
jgi:chorismate lyase